MKIGKFEDFVSVISEELPSICLFHQNEDELIKIKPIVEKIEKEAPLLNVYTYSLEDKKIRDLAEIIEVPETPALIVYKDGNFSRYKNKRLNDKEIRKFIGSLRKYNETKGD